MKITKYPQKSDWKNLVQRPTLEKQNLKSLIAEVFDKVSKNGDEALRFYSENLMAQKLLILKFLQKKLKRWKT